MPLNEAPPDALAGVYARSLFDVLLPAGRDAVESALGDLEEVTELARSNPKFAEILGSRLVSVDARAAFLTNVFGAALPPSILNFLRVLNRRDRLSHLPAIVAAFDNLVHAEFGRVEVDVFSAEPLKPQTLELVTQRLAQAIGKDVVVHPYTDGTMLGGVRFRIGDQLIDGSLATQLRRMRQQFTDATSSLRDRMGRILGS